MTIKLINVGSTLAKLDEALYELAKSMSKKVQKDFRDVIGAYWHLSGHTRTPATEKARERGYGSYKAPSLKGKSDSGLVWTGQLIEGMDVDMGNWDPVSKKLHIGHKTGERAHNIKGGLIKAGHPNYWTMFENTFLKDLDRSFVGMVAWAGRKVK